jgi:hypothetical protein
MLARLDIGFPDSERHALCWPEFFAEGCLEDTFWHAVGRSSMRTCALDLPIDFCSLFVQHP